jgi:signal transduction histidine kinase
MSSPPAAFARYQDLQRYVGWTQADEARIAAATPLVAPHFVELIEDFYAEIQRHPAASRVITGGPAQIERLKLTLRGWLSELFSGPYDEPYVARRWRVGLRHVEIGLPQVYTAAALARLRSGLIRVLRSQWRQDESALTLTLQSLNKLLDLDLAIISDAYETDYVRLQQEAERRRLDDVLHREKEISSGLFTHAHAAVLILDRAGHIVRANPYLEPLLASCAQGPLEEYDWFELFLQEQDRKRLRAALLDPRPDAAEALTAASTLVLDGRTRHLHWSCVPLYDAAGATFAVLVIGHDISDLVEAQTRAVQAERLAAIGQMATGLAHESRNALQRIGASAEMLELELEGHSAGLALVARIQHAQVHLHRLLEEVRSYAAPMVLDRSACRISEIWREAWELLLSARRGREATLREHIAARELSIEVDRFRLVQVLRNLLDNSLAAAADPVVIDVFCNEAKLGGQAALSIRVCDNGPGLSPEQRRRIFEPFYTTKPTGTGLGMAIAQRVIEAHGGTIAVGDNNDEPGAEIIITLPRQAAG